jgi:hypothetical protein
MTTDVQDRSNQSPRLTESKAQDPADGLGRAENTASDAEAEGAGKRTEMQALFTETDLDGPTPATDVSKVRRYCVYRFFDYDEVLLYVGLSCRLGQRLAEHRADKGWWRDVADIKVSHCAGRSAPPRNNRGSLSPTSGASAVGGRGRSGSRSIPLTFGREDAAAAIRGSA